MSDDGAAPVRPGNSERADYPRMLYHADGRTLVVETPEEHDKLHAEGWDTVPAEIHGRRVPTPDPVNTNDPMVAIIRQVMHEVMDERGLGKRRAR